METVKRKKENTAFTLLEVILAVAILATAVFILTHSFLSVIKAQGVLLSRAQALFLLQKKICGLELEAGQQQREGRFEAPDDKFFFKIDFEPTEYKNLHKAFVEVFWKDGRGKEESLNTATYVKLPEGEKRNF